MAFLDRIVDGAIIMKINASRTAPSGRSLLAGSGNSPESVHRVKNAERHRRGQDRRPLIT